MTSRQCLRFSPQQNAFLCSYVQEYEQDLDPDHTALFSRVWYNYRLCFIIEPRFERVTRFVSRTSSIAVAWAQ